jgi:hypothetical protein
MTISERHLVASFYLYNDEYFGGVLPFPKFKVRHSFRTLGYFSCEYDETEDMFNQTIEISDNYDYTESQFRDIFVHEMIHYYLAYMGIDPQCHHGKDFRKMASEFNSKYGMNITSTIDLTPYSIKKGKSKLMYTLSTLF